MALLITGLTYFSAEAQHEGKKNCEVIQTKVCVRGGDCYKTQYAENFKVCKNDHGYFICCEPPEYYNSTHTGFVATNYQNPDGYSQNYMQNEAYTPNEATVSNNLPQSQSYTGYYIVPGGTYTGYYFQKGKIKACYVGDNVADLNRDPYFGCPSPQYDGPEKNNERNLNVVTQ